MFGVVQKLLLQNFQLCLMKVFFNFSILDQKRAKDKNSMNIFQTTLVIIFKLITVFQCLIRHK